MISELVSGLILVLVWPWYQAIDRGQLFAVSFFCKLVRGIPDSICRRHDRRAIC
jgi:hypothetical protein